MKKSRRKKYYIATWKAFIFAVSFILLIMLKNVWLSVVATEAYRYCPKLETYQTVEPPPSGDIKAIGLENRTFRY